MQRIYFDNATTTQLAPEVFQSMLPYLKENFGNPSIDQLEKPCDTNWRGNRQCLNMQIKTLIDSFYSL